MNSPAGLDSLPLAGLKGIGRKTLERLDKLGLRTVQDLLFHLPLRYQDRTRLQPLGMLQPGDWALVEGRVELTESGGGRRSSLVCRIADGSGSLVWRFFHYSAAQRARLNPGARVQGYGEVRLGYYGPEMTHPDYHHLAEGEAGSTASALTPVYPLTEGLHQKTLQKLMDQALALARTHGVSDPLNHLAPSESLDVPHLIDALRLLHAPPAQGKPADLERARRRIAFEELVAHQLGGRRLRARVRHQGAPSLRLDDETAEGFRSMLPFRPTEAQRRVMAEIAADLANDKPMMRLVQGDVGSGKTVVAAWAALAALASGYQVALMAPTALLAEQHHRNLSGWIGGLGYGVALLAGKSKGTARQAVLDQLVNGSAGLAIGTHALFQQEVAFRRLGLVIIDEQHRFGVHQRLALREKGADGLTPHQLIMTATPIPRTLAMLGYADLDLSVIDQLPPGRTPVKTVALSAARRAEVIDRIVHRVRAGGQVYWVCTLIEESELLQCEAAENTHRQLQEALPGLRVALLHGRMKPDQKEAVMAAFKAGDGDLLVATTVIEVGVDVPNATLMVIENAERLGLAQLHQLRGRVGRGSGESHCVLLYQPPLSNGARQRLGVMRESNDGFYIAERDLQLRGPGELLGVRQAGNFQLRIADLGRDSELLEQAKDLSDRLLEQHPDAVATLLERWLPDASRVAAV
ncbi:MAG: ATP-dependent DNA helicase RecG [Methylococcaceae bacterium]|nr:ATP-dependent DNA helicase RecG [Methylococcaceae bacterium]